MKAVAGTEPQGPDLLRSRALYGHIDNRFTTTTRDETELTVNGDWLNNSPPLTH